MSNIHETDFQGSDRTARQKRVIVEILILAAIVFIGWPSFYIVDQSEQAVVTMFGKPVKIILNPIEDSNSQALMDRLRKKYEAEGITVTTGAGLRLKIPYIQKAEKLERRLLRWNGYPEQIPTKDKKYIWVASTARWYIEDPLQFLRSVGTEEQAHARLDDIIDSTARNSITSRDLLEIVRTKDRQMQVAEEELRETIQVGKVTEGRAAIVKEITALSSKACEEYGIRIHPDGVLIKGLTYVESVKEKVEDRMIEERLRIAKKYTSEGEGEYERIMGNKEREIKTILSEAYKTARQIEGQADAKAVEIYAAAYSKDPEFYRFWKTLELYETSLGGEKTKLMLGTDNSLFEYLKGQKKP
jgi:membrane protease subunit HflC